MSLTLTTTLDNGVLPTNGGLFTRLSSKPEGEGAACYPEENPRKRTTIPQSATIGLAPQVNPRPPATTQNLTISSFPEDIHLSDDDFLMQSDSDSEHLLIPNQPRVESMETESTPRSTNITDKLLMLSIKKTSVAMAKAKAHLNFVSTCSNSQQTPKGLKVNVKCSAFLSDLSDVKNQNEQRKGSNPPMPPLRHSGS